MMPSVGNRYGDMLKELYDGMKNNSLSEPRLAQIQETFNMLSAFQNIQGSWIDSDKNIKTSSIKPYMVQIYKNVLEKDTASIIVPLDGIFHTVIIYASGTITSATGGNIWAQFNGDTGNNYSWVFLKGDGSTASAAEDAADPYVALGVFGTTGAGAGVNGSFRSEIIHTQGIWKKNVLSHAYTAEFNALYLLGSTWQNTDPINSIEIFGTDNTLAKGSTNLAKDGLFSVYGLRI